MNTSWLQGSAELVAQRLIGCELVRTFADGRQAVVRIVETEAYDETDPASHSYKGKTTRTDVMFGPAGGIYVYFTYGMHYCMNIVTGPIGHGAAVLIRAVEPVRGEEVLYEHRPATGVALTNGPAKLCQAMAIDKEMNGHDSSQPPLQLRIKSAIHRQHIVASPRIGITKAVDKNWRFCEVANSYCSW